MKVLPFSWRGSALTVRSYMFDEPAACHGHPIISDRSNYAHVCGVLQGDRSWDYVLLAWDPLTYMYGLLDEKCSHPTRSFYPICRLDSNAATLVYMA